MVKQIGQRIKKERELKNISQEKLAKAIGWNHHQIVSEVERGDREIKAWELYEISKYLAVDIDILMGNKESEKQPLVLWRDKPEQDKELLESHFLSECDSYIWLEQLVSGTHDSGVTIMNQLPKIKIDLKQFSLDDAYELANQIRGKMSLGDFPAAQLVEVLEEYGIKFIVGDENIKPSAACSRSERGCFIFINGRNPEPRQYFSIAHELFHLVTWDENMLSQVSQDPNLHEKNEQLANVFAAGLLIPEEKLQTEVTRSGAKPITASDIIALAEKFQVSKEAMMYRMRNVSLISKRELENLKRLLAPVPTSKTANFPIVDSLKSQFVRLVYLACEHVKISRAKAAKLLKVDLCDLSYEFNKFGFVEVNA